MQTKSENTNVGNDSIIETAARRADNEGNQASSTRLWLRLAEFGCAKAQYEVAERYRWGIGVKASNKEASKWYLRAAEQGIAEAQLEIGLMYGNGEGVRKDSGQAVKWLWHAKEQGNGLAQLVLECDYSMN